MTKENPKSSEEHDQDGLGDTVNVHSTRRTAGKVLAGAVGAILLGGFFPAIGGLALDWVRYRSHVSIADRKIYSPGYVGERWQPGGISFALRNDGNRKSLFTGARIVIEKYARLKVCTPGQGGSALTESCYSVTLPVDVTQKKTINVGLRQVAENENFTYCNLTFSSSEKDQSDMHLYLLNVDLLQDNDAIIEGGRFIIATPKESILTSYWVPERIVQDSKTLGREEYLRTWAGGQNSTAEQAIQCATINDEAVKNIFSTPGELFMSPIMESVKQTVMSGEYNPKTYEVPQSGVQYKPKCED